MLGSLISRKLCSHCSSCVYTSHSHQKQNGDGSGELSYHSSTMYLNGQLRPLTWSKPLICGAILVIPSAGKSQAHKPGREDGRHSLEEVQGANATNVEVRPVREDIVECCIEVGAILKVSVSVP